MWGTGPDAKYRGVCLARNKNLAHLSQQDAVPVGVFKVEVQWSQPLVQESSEEKRYKELKVVVRRKVMSKSKHLRSYFGRSVEMVMARLICKNLKVPWSWSWTRQAGASRTPFHDIDDDGSGQITYDEFHDGLTELTENVMDSDNDEDNEDGIAPDGSDGRYVIEANLYSGMTMGVFEYMIFCRF